MKREILQNCEVVCCTSIISGTLKNMYFPLVVVDEATQAIEPATIVSLTV
jgi:superfamily I DNA and/or RNA helicase